MKIIQHAILICCPMHQCHIFIKTYMLATFCKKVCIYKQKVNIPYHINVQFGEVIHVLIMDAMLKLFSSIFIFYTQFLLLLYTYITLNQSLEMLEESHGRLLVIIVDTQVFNPNICSYSLIQKPQKKKTHKAVTLTNKYKQMSYN